MSASLDLSLPARGRASVAQWIGVYIVAWLTAFLLVLVFFVGDPQILLPFFATIAVFLYFSFQLRRQIRDNIFGEIGFVYLAFAVAYTVFPAYGFLTLSSLSSGVGFENLAKLLPDHGELGLQLWRQLLFITAVAFGYLLFRGRHAAKFSSFDTFGDAEKLVVRFLFVMIAVSVLVLWSLSAPVSTYIDNYTRYDALSWIGRRAVTICMNLKTGGTFVLLTIMFRNYKRYRLYIWPFVLLRAVQEVLASLGARIDAFIILVAAALLYHYCVRQITLRKGLLVTLAFGLVFSMVEVARLTDLNPSVVERAALHEQGMPAGELGAVFVPAFHLYAERASGNLPHVEWQVFFNDFISLIPLVDKTRWSPMYWYARNYFPDAVVPPLTVGPIAMSAVWGGEIGLFVEGFINGILFAFLMRWFARRGGGWQVMTVYLFCYSTCIMCLKYSILWHLTPLVKIVLPVVLIVSLLAKLIQESTRAEAGRIKMDVRTAFEN